MKASELISQLSTLMLHHGDCDIYYIYDYIIVPVNKINHCNEIQESIYADKPKLLTNIFTINSNEENE